MIVNYSNQEILIREKSIFLAGPTSRDCSLTCWRKEAICILSKIGYDGVVYVPEFEHNFNKYDYMNQVYWEREAMNVSNVISFWIPRKLPEMPAFTTNVEFGYWLKSGKIIYGRPNNAEQIRYLDWIYKKELKLEPLSNLYDLMQKSIDF